ncbi:rrna methyltransferase mitochondrial [Fusarium longipes]|uniref:rRNA methyltransferase 1, mitochondrial n=1 Tax=Fusarium longipes TaxID=694270 RepID=A0A395S6T4_9HYPO|nr:rrna methyltransferase mitochondrial [Fusarium longipes]
MIYPTQLRVSALCQPLTRFHVAQKSFAPVFVRGKALSAIHRGVRREFARQEPGASNPSSFARSPRSSRRETPLVRREAFPTRRDPFAEKFNARAVDNGSQTGTRNWRQEQKLRKKLRKKDEEKKAQEEREADGTGRRTRRRRFADSENEFGNRSLVQRMKYGDLKEVADSLQVKQPIKPRSFREARRERAREFGIQDENQRNQRRPERSERSEPRFDRSDGQFDRSDRQVDRQDRSGRQFDRPERLPDQWSDKPSQRYDNSDRNAHRRDDTRNDRWNNQGDDSNDVYAVERAKRNGMMAMTVKYTTAASQFLYGRSVVKAALEQNRRKLYNLYIYGGENRRDNKDNTIMTRMAQKHGVPITIVPTEEQRIMDKMSMGRPHNGFVLEASPLPQSPIKSLGRLEESTGRLGFHVDLDFQTKEEVAVNGTDTFTRRSNNVTPKPFVLLLNEIIDPGNLGGIIRTASYLGVDAVCITNRGSSTLTPVVLKSAAGAVEEISLFTVDDPVKFIEESGKAGWKTYAAVAPPDRKLVRRHGDKFISLDSIEVNNPLNEHPCLLILGNEGHGLSKPVKVAADYELSVPRFVQGSCVDSLNVSVAAGLLCHAFVKEPVVEIKSEPTEKNTKTETGSFSISEQAEKTTEEVGEAGEAEVTTKEEENASEEKQKKVEETNEAMF